MKGTEFLKQKGMIRPGFNHFIVNGDFGSIDLGLLLDEFKGEALIEVRKELVAASSMVGKKVEGQNEGKNLLDYAINRIDNNTY